MSAAPAGEDVAVDPDHVGFVVKRHFRPGGEEVVEPMSPASNNF
jgi:hypothetical protein